MVLPVKRIRIDDPAFWGERRAVPRVKAQIQRIMTQFVAKMGIIPVDIAHQFTSIGIDEQLMRVKAMPVFRIIRPVDAIAIQRAGLEVGHIAVPDLVGIFRQLQTGDFRFTGGSNRQSSTRSA